MNGYLVDTNVLSEFGKSQQPEPRVKLWVETTAPRTLFASVVTWGEFRKGIEGQPSEQRRAGLEHWLEHDLREWFQSRLLPVTRTIADRWGVLAGQFKLKGRALTMGDGLIAATALEHDLTLATRNVRDFSGLGVTIFNPWNL
jgi:predicted nucleic acid-binding protein